MDGVTRPSSGKNYLQLSGLPAESMEEGRPVTNLRFHSAISYCEWLSPEDGMIFRLPTETEGGVAGGVDGLAVLPRVRAPPDFGPVLRGEGRRTIPPSGTKRPQPPVSTWWFRTGHSQASGSCGSRAATPPPPRKAVEITGLKGEERTVRVGRSISLHEGERRGPQRRRPRGGGNSLLKVYYLDPAGKPHFEDVTSNLTRRATFNICAPALRNSAHPGPQARPLAPGERRPFAVDLPLTMDADADVQEKFGASVVHLRFAGD